MAIWPFGRKGKRHTVQVDADRRGSASPQGARHSFDEGNLSRKPTRKNSKRRKNRYSQFVDDYPANLNSPSGQLPQPAPSNQTVKAQSFHASSAPDAGPMSLSRNPSLRKPKRQNEGPAVLKKRLSKRKAYEIAREREVRLMASMPIDIPRRTTPSLPGDYMHDGRRASAHDRRMDRHRSDVSLSIQEESAASSLSDFSETYTFKVNGFAAWTPRPVIRYVEAPRTSYSRNQKSPELADRRKSPTLEVSNEDLRSKKRIDELANGLDAGSIRELMERDRRRQERKQVKDHEKLVRKLQRNAEKVPKPQEPSADPPVPEDQTKEPESQRGRSSPHAQTQTQPTKQETETFLAGEDEGSWLRDTSRDPQRDGRKSPESVNVIGNIDDSSIREPKISQRFSFGPSQDMTMSRSTLAASVSPSRRDVHSPDSSQLYGMTRESVSDVSKHIGSERRLSDHSSANVNPITSIFRRGSSRLKRSYRERFPNRSPPPAKNVSHESFFKVQTQTPAPAPYVPPKVLLGSSSFKRSQSKFTEHFGDEPLSPPDSRLQSPDIPEDGPLPEDRVPDLNSGSYYPIPSSGTDARNKHHSWAGESVDEDPDNVLLSQSLASVDSEGSWMSGQFLRRISQRKPNSARQSLSSSRNRTDEGVDKSQRTDVNSNDAQFTVFGAYPEETIGDGSNAVEDQDKDITPVQPAAASAETWHQDVGKRAVVVNPAIRPKSNEGLLKNVRSLSLASAEAEFGTIEEHSAEVFSAEDDAVTPVQAHHS